MSRGIGRLQRDILDALETDPNGIGRYGMPAAVSCAWLSAHILGDWDRDNVRRMRRAVDSLDTRNLIEGTWTGDGNNWDMATKPTERPSGLQGRYSRIAIGTSEGPAAAWVG